MSRSKCTRRQFVESVVLGAAGVVTASCRTAPESTSRNRPFTFVQLCDPQLGMGGYEHDLRTFRQAVAQINTLKPDFVVVCGDLVHDANDQSFADFREIRATLEVPCYCAPGNHDVGGTPTRASLERYRQAIGQDYYAIEHKGCLFVIVNTQLWKSPMDGESGKQDAWLEQTVEDASRKGVQTFVVGHYPLFLAQPDEAEEYMNLPLTKRTELLSLFDRCGVAAMLGGHVHRLVVNDYNGMQLVNGETTSKNFDTRPLGFRVWQVTDSRPFNHEFVGLEGV